MEEVVIVGVVAPVLHWKLPNNPALVASITTLLLGVQRKRESDGNKSKVKFPFTMVNVSEVPLHPAASATVTQ